MENINSNWIEDFIKRQQEYAQKCPVDNEGCVEMSKRFLAMSAGFVDITISVADWRGFNAEKQEIPVMIDQSFAV